MNAMHAYEQPGSVPYSQTSRLARLLSLPAEEDLDSIGLAKRVAAGLPTDAVDVLCDLLGRKEIVGPVVPEATLRRARKNGNPLPQEYSERIYALSRVVDALARVYHGDFEKMRRFLTGPHMLLRMETPLDLARSSTAGAEVVLELIHQAEAGVAV